MVVAGWVEGECSEDFAGGGLDDADVEVGDEQDHGGSGVEAADADVVESAAVAERNDAAPVDAVASDPVVGVDRGEPWLGFRAGRVGVGWGGALFEGAVRAVVVVATDEPVEECLELVEGGRLGLRGEPAFECLLEAFELPADGGVVRSRVLLHDATAGKFGLEAVASATAASEPGREHHAVVGQCRCWRAVGADSGTERGDHDRAGDTVVRGDR